MRRYQWNNVIKNKESEISIAIDWNCISIKAGRSWCSYLGISLYFPYIDAGGETFGFNDGKKYGIVANSEISVIETESYTQSKMQILGFGIGFSSQEGY